MKNKIFFLSSLLTISLLLVINRTTKEKLQCKPTSRSSFKENTTLLAEYPKNQLQQILIFKVDDGYIEKIYVDEGQEVKKRTNTFKLETKQLIKMQLQQKSKDSPLRLVG
jgi:membrane fusion protein (multidrug efflux system)